MKRRRDLWANGELSRYRQRYRVLPGNGDGTLQAGTDYSVGGNPISVVVGDLNRDSADDFVVVSQTDNNVSVFLNTGAGD